MSHHDTDTPVHVRLLANPQGQPGALLWHANAEPADALLTWLQHDQVQALASQVPCQWLDTEVNAWPEELQQAFDRAGMRRLPGQALTDCPTLFAAAGGTEWVSGHWFLQPPGKAASAMAASRASALQLVQLITADAETHELEEVFRHDAHLSYQLLRLVNSAGMTNGRTVSSFAQALLILGRQPLRRWVNLLLFSARDDDPRSAMLMAHVVLRARGMELLALTAGHDRHQQDQAFMAGLFSQLGTLFGQPLDQALAPLKLPTELQDALLHGQGNLGLLLRAWEAAEQANDATLGTALTALGVPMTGHNLIVPQACAWTWQTLAGTAST